MRQPERPDDAETDLRLCYTGPSPAREWQEAFERRFGLRVVVRVRDVGVAVRADLAARDAPVRHARRRRGSTRRSGPVNEARVVDDDGLEVGAGRHRRAAAAQPDVSRPGYWEMPEETAAADRGRLAAHRRPGHAPTPTARTRSSRGRRRCCAGAGRTSRRPRSRRRSQAHPDVLEVRGGRRPVGADRGRGQGVRRPRAGPGAGLRRAAGVGGRAAVRVQGAAVLAGSWTPCRARRPRGSPSTGCPPATPTASTTPGPDADRRPGAGRPPPLRCGRTGSGSARPRRSRPVRSRSCPGRTRSAPGSRRRTRSAPAGPRCLPARTRAPSR